MSVSIHGCVHVMHAPAGLIGVLHAYSAIVGVMHAPAGFMEVLHQQAAIMAVLHANAAFTAVACTRCSHACWGMQPGCWAVSWHDYSCYGYFHRACFTFRTCFCCILKTCPLAFSISMGK